MAISIDTVHQRVQALANKEQRGYITPQEFNLFANQAQMEIFERYFYDINQLRRAPGNDSEYSDPLDMLEEKISFFEKYKIAMSAVSGNQVTLPTDTYRLGTVFSSVPGYVVEVEKVGKKELEYMLRQKLTSPADKRPVYNRKSSTQLKVFPSSPSSSYSTSNVTCNYIAKPTTVVWGYAVINEQALYNANTSTDFSLHGSEETTLVMKILELAGITIKQPDIVQFAAQEDLQKTQLEKQ